MVATRRSQKATNGTESGDQKVQTSMDNFTQSNDNDNDNTAETNGRKKRIVEGTEGKSAKPTTGDEKDSTAEKELEHKPPHGKEESALDEVKADTDDVKASAQEEQEQKTTEISQNQDSIIEDSERASAIPSSILEKGIIYFFFRGRVGVEDPSGIEDVARSYFVLRPLPLGAKIGSGPLEDQGNARLLALPKKVWPKSKRDRFLVFVDRAGVSVGELREQMGGEDRATKTVGTSHAPASTPIAEGVYAITSTGRESHLAYQLTVPSSISEVQEELGLNSKGSFVCSVKNPDAPSPANASIGNPAKYPEDIQKKFRGLRWMPLEPELLDYEGAQMLIIGEAQGEFGEAVEEQSKDERDGGKEKPVEEMEKLGEEDHDRVEGLKEDDPIWAYRRKSIHTCKQHGRAFG
ncbi:BTB domain-containingtranscription factor protein [Rutstroemia sp. NJR-2017a BBW]|nr:BTB domain-containingtranscription factor protein [Rutstroemia sp. NJR-2017a BBW]